MIPYDVRDGQLRYLITTPDGRTKPTQVPDTPDNRWYLGFAHRAPLAHQVRDFVRFKDRACFALFYEQRARKTKVDLDVFRYRCQVVGDVDALVVVAYPNGVHRGWLDELALDFPPEVLANTRSLAWASGKTDSKRGKEEAFALRDHPGPIVVTMNSEAVARSKNAMKYLEWLFARRNVMLTADESAFMANWTSVTQKMLKLGRTTKARRGPVVKSILDGTPVEEGPGEIFFPAQFLRYNLLGHATKEAFKARYFEYEEEDVAETRSEPAQCANCGGSGHDLTGDCPICGGLGTVEVQVPTGVIIRQRVKKKRHVAGGRGAVLNEYEVFKGYRNLEELEAKMKEFGSRVLRTDVSDAPAKTYQSRYFDLTPVQRKVYDDLRDRYVTELSGRTVTTANVLLRMTRLQMAARNYYPPEKVGEGCTTCGGEGFTDDGEDCPDCGGIGVVVRTTDLERIDPNHNPALDAVRQELLVSRCPALIWCRFRQDVIDVLDTTKAMGLTFFRYDGGIPEAEREADYRRFRAGEGDGMVATERSGLQRGHDCSRADLSIFYSNEFGLRHRRQAEDRTEGLDNLVGTSVVDLVAADTRDIDVIDTLRAKRSVAALIMGDPVTRWL
jgi:hypothetical protein